MGNKNKLTNEKTDNYQLKVFDIYRKRKAFSFLGFTVVGKKYNNTLKWTGNLFGYVNIKERKIKERYSDFDSGWTYQSYWKEWKERWVLEEILNK